MDNEKAIQKANLQTSVKTLPPPPKSAKPKADKIPQKETTVAAKPEVNVKAPVQVDNPLPKLLKSNETVSFKLIALSHRWSQVPC